MGGKTVTVTKNDQVPIHHNEPRPDGATHKHNNLFYKIGVHSMLFFWSGKGWVKSTKCKISLIRECYSLSQANK